MPVKTRQSPSGREVVHVEKAVYQCRMCGMARTIASELRYHLVYFECVLLNVT